MNETNPKQLAMLGGLIVVVLAVMVYQFGGSLFGGGSSTTAQSTAKSQIPETRFVEVDLNVDDLIERTKSINFDYEQERIDRDPMRPLVGQLAQRADLPFERTVSGPTTQYYYNKSITGIVWDPYNPQAVVDNEVVGIGHVYPDGGTVYDIEEKRVTFAVNDSFIRVDMKEPGQ